MTSRSSNLLSRRGTKLAGLSVSSLSLPVASPAPDFFSKYSICKQDFRGCGSSASVYAVDDSESASVSPISLRKKVVKIYSTSDEATIEAAHNEVNILKRLPPHENIVQFCEHFEHESPKQLYIVLEDAGDISLDAYVRRKARLDYESVRSLARQLVEAVRHLH